jgi:hypothetical protein
MPLKKALFDEPADPLGLRLFHRLALVAHQRLFLASGH